MTNAHQNPSFYPAVLALWGEKWRPELRALMGAHGFREPGKSRLWRWKTGQVDVPGEVMHLLEQETKKRSTTKGAKL